MTIYSILMSVYHVTYCYNYYEKNLSFSKNTLEIILNHLKYSVVKTSFSF